MRVTLVGSGRYAREIVARNYQALDAAMLCAVVTPRDSAESLATTPLRGLPVVRTIGEWRAIFGRPTEEDVFDLCVHPAVLPDLVESLIAEGARRMVLPKPVATTPAALERMAAAIKASQAVAAVASQWRYSQVTERLAAAVAPAAAARLVTVNFSQLFSADQLTRYTPATALLPHMLEILISTGLWGEEPRPAVLEVDKAPTRWHLAVRTSVGCRIELVTDLRAEGLTREIRVESAAGRPHVMADFAARFEAGRLVAPPSVTMAGHRHEIHENNIRVMVQRTLAGFCGGPDFLSFDRYRPQAEALLGLCEA